MHKYIHIDQVHTHVVGTVTDFLRKAGLLPTPKPQVLTTMRDLVASKAPKAPTIREAFAPALVG